MSIEFTIIFQVSEIFQFWLMYLVYLNFLSIQNMMQIQFSQGVCLFWKLRAMKSVRTSHKSSETTHTNLIQNLRTKIAHPFMKSATKKRTNLALDHIIKAQSWHMSANTKCQMCHKLLTRYMDRSRVVS